MASRKCGSMMINCEYVPIIVAENTEKINFRVDILLENKMHIFEEIGTASVVLAKADDSLLYFRAVSKYINHQNCKTSVVPCEEIKVIKSRIIEVCKDLKAVWG